MSDTPATTTRTKRRVKHDYAKGTFVLGGLTYATSDLPAAQITAAAQRGLASYLLAEEFPATAFDDLKSGAKSLARAAAGAKPEKPAKALSPWRLAAAYAHAEAQARAAGIKAQPGKKLYESAGIAPYLESAKAIVAGWTSEQLATAKKHEDVRRHHARIVGEALPDLAALFATPASEPEPIAEAA